MNEIILDNSEITKFPREGVRNFILRRVTIYSIAFVIGVIAIYFLSSSLSEGIYIGILTFIIFGSMVIILWNYVLIFPQTIILTETKLTLIKNNKKEISVKFGDIKELIFSRNSYDIKGNPCPRWIIECKPKIVPRLINLSDKNAIILAKELDKRNINYLLDTECRKEWEEKTGWNQ